MLDVTYIRENTDLVKQAMLNKGEKDTTIVDKLLEIDSEWRLNVRETDDLRNSSNKRAKMVGALMGQGKKEEAQVIIKETAEAKKKIKENEVLQKNLQDQRLEFLYNIPNVPHPSVPVGSNETDNKVYATWGEPEDSAWKKPHWEIVEEHGWVDFKRGVKVTGAGFPFYTGPIAKLQRSLINFFLDKGGENGYAELQAPFFVNEDSARGTGQIPDKEDQMYTVPRDGFFAIPTAELPVTNFHRNEIIPVADLPVKYCAYTPCWRREAGSYGKDVRGLNRLHQFDKVELVKIVEPGTSYDELESLKNDAEGLLRDLGLPYQTLLMCTGDMGFTQAKKYDLEIWSVGQKRWLEVSSCSNFESFQARRMKLRYRDTEGSIHVAHTLNGSGLALPRIVAGIIENYQTEAGKVVIPEVLRDYMKTDIIG